MKYYINQPAGLGDILYLFYAAEHIDGEIIWPICREYYFSICKYFPHHMFPNISIRKLEKDMLVNYKSDQDYVVLDTDRSYSYVPNKPLMASKYYYLNEKLGLSLEPRYWANGEILKAFLASIFADERIKETITNYLWKYYAVIMDKDSFVFINQFYGSPPEERKSRSISNEAVKDFADGRIAVYLEFIPSLNVFHWFRAAHYAQGVMTMETSLQYLLAGCGYPGPVKVFAKEGRGHALVDEVFDEFTHWERL